MNGTISTAVAGNNPGTLTGSTAKWSYNIRVKEHLEKISSQAISSPENLTTTFTNLTSKTAEIQTHPLIATSVEAVTKRWSKNIKEKSETLKEIMKKLGVMKVGNTTTPVFGENGIMDFLLRTDQGKIFNYILLRI